MSKQRLATIVLPKRLTGQQLLWAAVLGNAVMGLEQRGIFTYRKDNIDHQKRTLQNESLIWLESEDTALGSFIFICDTLHIDPDFLRARLLNTYVVAHGTTEPERRSRRFRLTLS